MGWSASLDRSGRSLFVAAIFLVPLVFVPQTLDLINLPKITLLGVLIVLAAGSDWIAREEAGRPQHSRSFLAPVPLLAVTLLLVTAIATALSPNRTLSIVGTPGRYEGLGSLVIYVGVLLLTVALYSSHRDDLRAVLRAGGAATAVAATYVLLQKAGIDVVEWVFATNAPYPIGPLGNSTFTSVFLGVGMSFLVYLVRTTRDGSSRIAWIVVCSIDAVALWFTQGRAGMAAAVASVIFVLLFMSSVRAWMKLVAVLATLLTLALAPFALARSGDANQAGVTRTETLHYRVELWTAAWNMALDRPILGWGPASFSGQMGKYRTPNEARQQGLHIADSPHNVFLTWLSSTGMIGLGLFLALIGTALFKVATRVSSMDASRREMLAAFGGCLVAYLVGCMFTINVPPLAFLSWLALGAITVLAQRAPAENGDPPPNRDTRSKRSTLIKRASVACVIGVLVALVIGPLRADYAAGRAEKRSVDGWSPSTLELYERAIAINPREAAYRVLLARYLDRVAETVTAPYTPLRMMRRAASLYDQALTIQPFSPALMVDGARAYARLASAGDPSGFETANSLMERAARVDPLDPEVYDAHADVLDLWASRSKGGMRRELTRRSRQQAAKASELKRAETSRTLR